VGDFIRPFNRSIHALTPNAGNRRVLVPNRGIGGGINYPFPPPDTPVFANFAGQTSFLEINALSPPLVSTTQMRAVVKFKMGATPDGVEARLLVLSFGTGASGAFVFSRTVANQLQCRIVSGTATAANSQLTFTAAGGTGNPGGAADSIVVIASFNCLLPLDPGGFRQQGFSIYVNGVLVEWVQFSAGKTTINLAGQTAIAIGGNIAGATSPFPFTGAISEVRFWTENGAEVVSFSGSYADNSPGAAINLTSDAAIGQGVVLTSGGPFTVGQQVWMASQFFNNDQETMESYRVLAAVPGVSFTVTPNLTQPYTAATAAILAVRVPPGQAATQALGLPPTNGAADGVQPQVFFGGGRPVSSWNAGLNVGTYPNFNVLPAPPLT
jgi:hypothetical protein